MNLFLLLETSGFNIIHDTLSWLDCPVTLFLEDEFQTGTEHANIADMVWTEM